MSLTSKLKGKDEKFKEIMKNSIPSKNMFNTLSGKKVFSNEYILKVPSNLSNSYYATVVGTAFDYLSRFIAARVINENKESSYENLVAERGLSMLNDMDPEVSLKLYKKYEEGIKEIKKFIFNKDRFISKESILENIIYISCYYARLEHISRSGILPVDIKATLFDKEQKEIVDDLKNLCNVFEDTFIKSHIINEKSEVVFNPTFGLCSFKIGGADGDIFIDGTLYDFKTSINKGYKWVDIAQIWGYYVFNLIAISMNDHTAVLSSYNIERIAIYKARYGEVEYIDTKMIEDSVKFNIMCEIKEYLAIDK